MDIMLQPIKCLPDFEQSLDLCMYVMSLHQDWEINDNPSSLFFLTCLMFPYQILVVHKQSELGLVRSLSSDHFFIESKNNMIYEKREKYSRQK